ncbi:MAG TPA: hypothetical protein VMC62_02940 [Longilinea sp.]|nr:hypothetical protein [Longilinea sp.]
MTKRIILALSMMAILLLGSTFPVQAATPSFYISNIESDVSVSIKTLNFPANTTFNVYMGPGGTQGINGVLVAVTNSGDGGTFGVTYNIPDDLKGAFSIDIRMDSDSGYHMYKNFINRIDGSTSTKLTGHNLILYVVSVVKDTSVTLRTQYFPTGQDFLVRMGRYGTHGLGGDEITTINTGDSGIFNTTLTIPSDLQGKSPLDVRFDDVYGQSAEISFYNCTGCGQAPKLTPVYLSDLTSNAASSSSSSSSYYRGLPATSLVSVVTDTSVTFYGYNFPTNQDFTVTIGPYGTYGVGGVVVGTTNSGASGSFTTTYPIPSQYAGSTQLSIRWQGSVYYAYDWFNNSTTGSTSTSTSSSSSTTTSYYYGGIPSTSFVSVVANTSVTFTGANFPPNQTFTVTIAPYGTLGTGGVVVGTTDTGSSGSFTATYTIPSQYAGSTKLSIRWQGPVYYAYDWFNNQ